jgi:ACT domain-containing protein
MTYYTSNDTIPFVDELRKPRSFAQELERILIEQETGVASVECSIPDQDTTSSAILDIRMESPHYKNPEREKVLQILQTVANETGVSVVSFVPERQNISATLLF